MTKKITLVGKSIGSAAAVTLFLKSTSKLESGVFFENDITFVFAFLAVLVYLALSYAEKFYEEI